MPRLSQAVLCWNVAAVLMVSGVLLTTAAAQQATPASAIQVPEGFEVELLRSAAAGEGSWISMTFDSQGRIIVGIDDVGLGRITRSDPDKNVWDRFERIENTLRHCRGVLYAYDSLYVCATDSKGFYRLRDLDGDDQYETLELLKAMDYRSRYGHGTNQVVLGPDGMLYIVNGNDVSFPEGSDPNSPYRDPQTDLLLPDPHDAGQDARVGHIVRTDRDGQRWEILSGGLRNQVDVAFNEDGELFTWDADMEWDVGLPWYRPTRLNHLVSAGEYGWRWGSGKWPPHYEDSLPATLETGLGSPTALEFGTRSHFPAAYRSQLFMADWQHGRILNVRLTPEGASYHAEADVFLQGAPLSICDLQFGPDGAMYLITGGRGSQSGLYRVRYVGPAEETTSEPHWSEHAQQAAAARKLRHELEQYHTKSDPEAVERVWPHLGSSDRWIRFAARVALERQPLERWKSRALEPQSAQTAISAWLAWARTGQPEDQAALLGAMQTLELQELPEEQLIGLLRAYALAFIRLGRPSPETTADLAERFDAIYPHTHSLVNRELCELLVYLEHPAVVAKTLGLMRSASSQEEQLHYAHALVRLDRGWSVEERREFLGWLDRARQMRGGRLLPVAVQNMQSDFLQQLNASEKEQLKEEIAALSAPNAAELVQQTRPIVRHWTLEQLLPELSRVERGRSYASGRRALEAAQCLQCHRFGSGGRAIGPDLTQVGKRYDLQMMAESVIHPSKAIDPKYGLTTFVLHSGKVVTGRVAFGAGEGLTVEMDPLTGESMAFERKDIESTSPSPVSPMPEGLLDVLTLEEILDLLAVLQSGDDPKHPAFQEVSSR